MKPRPQQFEREEFKKEKLKNLIPPAFNGHDELDLTFSGYTSFLSVVRFSNISSLS
jgi:hypothetical protein